MPTQLRKSSPRGTLTEILFEGQVELVVPVVVEVEVEVEVVVNKISFERGP